MTCSINPITKDTVIVTIAEYLDFRNSQIFKTLLVDQFNHGMRNFILDFSRTKILDSTGLGSVFMLYRQLQPLGGRICFASVSGSVKVTVNLARLYNVFPQFPSVEAARKDRTSQSERTPPQK